MIDRIGTTPSARADGVGFRGRCDVRTRSVLRLGLLAILLPAPNERGFGCSAFPPPSDGDALHLMLGTCGANGRCVPAS